MCRPRHLRGAGGTSPVPEVLIIHVEPDRWHRAEYREEFAELIRRGVGEPLYAGERLPDGAVRVIAQVDGEPRCYAIFLEPGSALVRRTPPLAVPPDKRAEKFAWPGVFAWLGRGRKGR